MEKSARNPGSMVRHEDGRKGIVYNKNQRHREDGKVIVNFFDKEGNLDNTNYAVDVGKLTKIGYVD